MPAVAVSVVGSPVRPAVIERLPGVAVKVKSAAGGADATLSARVAEWLNEPDVPVKMMLALPICALAAALRVTLCAEPAGTLRVEGLAVTPTGNPASATSTLPVNPFAAEMVMETALPPAPAVSAKAVGATEIAKSDGGGGAATVSDTVDI